jgi:hypothetical protein
MLQADLFCRVVENRFTKPHELGRRSHVRIIWWAKPLPAVDIEMGNLAMEGLTPAQCRDLARNILEAAAKAEAYPGSPTEIRPADSTARGDQGLQVSEQALAEMGPVGDRYAATPCGTFCDDCMVEHAKECEVCRHEFDIPETGAEGE